MVLIQQQLGRAINVQLVYHSEAIQGASMRLTIFLVAMLLVMSPEGASAEITGRATVIDGRSRRSSAARQA